MFRFYLFVPFLLFFNLNQIISPYTVYKLALILIYFFLAYGKVFLVRKIGGNDNGILYAMKVLEKETIIQKKKTAEHTITERLVSF